MSEQENLEELKTQDCPEDAENTASEASKEKKAPRRKGKVGKIILTIVCVLLTIVMLIAAPLIVEAYKYFYLETDTGINPVDTHLTTEQKLKDLDYMYDVVCLQNPAKEEFEKAYGIKYEDVYNKYKDLVVNSKDEYEFFCYMASFLSDLPGEHNMMKVPSYAKTAQKAGFSVQEIYAPQKVKDYAAAWNEEFRDDVESYLKYSLVAFRYVDGKYYGLVPDSDKIKFVSDYENGEILTIDGKDPKDVVFDLFDLQVPLYDEGNNCAFRSKLFFNDGVGVKHTVEIRLADGSVVTTELYDDARYDSAFYAGMTIYPEMLLGKSSQDTETKPDVMSDEYEPTSYKIYKDPARKLVYIDSSSCNSSEGEGLVRDLTQALEEVDAETVILDIRSNSGGEIYFTHKQLLPVLFSHDVKFMPEAVGKKNAYTRMFYNSMINRFTMFKSLRFQGDYYYYSEDYSVKGQAKKNYKIYLLTGKATFSSGDIITCLCKEYDNCTVVGTATGGEGICGSICNCVLPESKFMFIFCPTVGVNAAADSYSGTYPDVYIHYTADEYFKKVELKKQVDDPETYEVRQKWDKTLQYVLAEVDNK